ncbi:MAG TPA: methylated-DNA--[protein]-cysteine S-methyltransferase [Gaiellaceae bacterium]|jgi:methylated-DNA-[protein]-cysteine S-methyltransferase|nr:methylated-DNA--[protein]-cysteine S-methyltransferase [Gaiellaceae bacterium]
MTAVPKALDQRFREAATEAGLVDVSFDVADTQIGPLLLAVTERGLCRISFDPEPDRETETLARTFGVRVLRAPRELDPVRRELDEYFEGRRRDFDLPLDLRGREGFSRDILERLAKVPYGEVTTYKSLAVEAGNPRAARAVGTIMNRNPIPIVLPCHRVVGSNGSLVGYGGGLERKRLLLDLEAGTPRLDIHLS